MKFRISWLLNAVCIGTTTLSAISVACSDDHPGEGQGGSVATGGTEAGGAPEAGAGHGGSPQGGSPSTGGHSGGTHPSGGTGTGPVEEGGCHAGGAGSHSGGVPHQGGDDGCGDGGLGCAGGQGGSEELGGMGGAPTGGGGTTGGEAGSSGGGGQPSRVCTALGAACLSTLHCLAGTYCSNFECVPAPGAGSPCVDNRCAAGATCNQGICIPLTVLSRGAVCEYCPGCVCESGLECHRTSAVDATEHCVEPIASEGESCWDRRCAEGFFCQGVMDFVAPTCVPNDAFFCGDKWPDPWGPGGCQPGLFCDGMQCVEQNNEGEPCGSLADWAQCAPGFYCDEPPSIPPLEGRCRPAILGTPCGNSATCLDGYYCYEGSCRERTSLGENCTLIPCAPGGRCNSPMDCQLFQSCDLPLDVCLPDAAPGEGCEDSRCSEGHFCMPTDPV